MHPVSSMLVLVALFALLNVATAFQMAGRVNNGHSSAVVMMADKSKSLPFLPQPANLVGLPGDVGKNCIRYVHS